MKNIISKLLAPVAVLTAMLALPSTAFACSCMRSEPAQQLQRSDTAFFGRVIRTERLGRFERVTIFSVSETLKGRRTRTQRIYHWENDGGNCGMNFRRGQRLLVLAAREKGRLRTNSCTMPMGSDADFRRLALERN